MKADIEFCQIKGKVGCTKRKKLNERNKYRRRGLR